MFNNIGKKIQTVAKVIAYIGIALSLLIGVAFVIYGIKENEKYFYDGIALLIVGPLTSWLSSLTMFGFGKLIEDTEAIRKDVENNK